jgi:hypothetical protein
MWFINVRPRRRCQTPLSSCHVAVLLTIWNVLQTCEHHVLTRNTFLVTLQECFFTFCSCFVMRGEDLRSSGSRMNQVVAIFLLWEASEEKRTSKLAQTVMLLTYFLGGGGEMPIQISFITRLWTKSRLCGLTICFIWVSYARVCLMILLFHWFVVCGRPECFCCGGNVQDSHKSQTNKPITL